MGCTHLTATERESIYGARASPTGVKLDRMDGGISRTLFPLSVDRRKLSRGFASGTGR